MRERQLRVSAAAEQREHAVSPREAGNVGPRGFDGAGGLETEDRRFTGRRRIMALTLDGVRTVDARRTHANQDAPGPNVGASTSPNFRASGPPNPSRTIAFTSQIRGVRAPVVEPERSPYYTAAQTGSRPGFPTK